MAEIKETITPPVVGALRVWWIPQVPGAMFTVPVASLEEAVKLMTVLADYDAFQFANKIKPDYCNAGGLSIWYEDGVDPLNSEWVDWQDERSGIDDPAEYLRMVAHYTTGAGSR